MSCLARGLSHWVQPTSSFSASVGSGSSQAASARPEHVPLQGPWAAWVHAVAQPSACPCLPSAHRGVPTVPSAPAHPRVLSRTQRKSRRGPLQSSGLLARQAALLPTLRLASPNPQQCPSSSGRPPALMGPPPWVHSAVASASSRSGLTLQCLVHVCLVFPLG